MVDTNKEHLGIFGLNLDQTTQHSLTRNSCSHHTQDQRADSPAGRDGILGVTAWAPGKQAQVRAGPAAGRADLAERVRACSGPLGTGGNVFLGRSRKQVKCCGPRGEGP